MTAQPQETNRVLRAFTFIARYHDGRHVEEGCIACSHAEARAIMEAHYAKFPWKVELFGNAFTVMQPGLIEWYDWQNKRHEAEGRYAFLNGMFFCKCGDHEVATHCGKSKSLVGNRLYATIYGGNHTVKPL